MFDSSGATLSNKDFELLTGLFMFPNPTKGRLYIKGDVSKLKSINIYSVYGQHIQEVKNNFSEINLEKLHSAIYFVKLSTEQASATFKILKE